MAVGTTGIGYGASIAYGDGGGPEAFTAIGRISDISGPEFELNAVDITNQDSPGGFEEAIPGLVSGGEVSLDVVLVEDLATQKQVRTDLLARTKRNWRVLKPGGHGYIFPGFPTKFGEAVPMGDKMVASMTFKVAGQPTLVTP